mmetsp:Transcript_23360/g.58628  ORF Transcript_23360/g.58628 Transcript_23360/m.58628 type:complete len:240 (+) Transcript_23360:110-829(+)
MVDAPVRCAVPRYAAHGQPLAHARRHISHADGRGLRGHDVPPGGDFPLHPKDNLGAVVDEGWRHRGLRGPRQLAGGARPYGRPGAHVVLHWLPLPREPGHRAGPEHGCLAVSTAHHHQWHGLLAVLHLAVRRGRCAASRQPVAAGQGQHHAEGHLQRERLSAAVGHRQGAEVERSKSACGAVNMIGSRRSAACAGPVRLGGIGVAVMAKGVLLAVRKSAVYTASSGDLSLANVCWVIQL